jgi:hypothetical protein
MVVLASFSSEYKSAGDCVQPRKSNNKSNDVE